MPRLGVLGWPVAHSRSPAIQNAALASAALEGWRYQLLPVPPALFAETVRALPGAGFAGANVTIPHKEAALAVCDDASPRAVAIGAVNTLVFDDGGQIRAENTDAPALIGSLPFAMPGRTAMVLGAGGSARAAVWALLDAGAGTVWVWNRTFARAENLVRQLGGEPARVPVPADLLVNCTSAGLGDAGFPVTPDELGSYAGVVDFVYRDTGTALGQAALSSSIAAVDGFELLVRQGALSFELFTGHSAPIEVMRSALR